ncbi:MAG: RloB domain-containing protein [Magnetococcales bacterium]|nr:RloB domain-containing protein [Magnetococcales bacterium]
MSLSQPKVDFGRRKTGGKSVPEKLLIVCEDSKSGLHYLEDLVDHLQLSSVTVIRTSSGGKDPKNLVDYTRKELNRQGFAAACAVFDGDVMLRGGTEKARFDAAIAKAASGIEVYVSVPCLEFWFLLHYEETDQPFSTCDEVGRRLGQKMGRYAKSLGNVFELLHAQGDSWLEKAMARAERIRHGNPDQAYPNPSTGMDRLIERLRGMVI